MNRTLLFDSPFLLGFDHTRALIERAAKAAGEGYPPYNVEELGEGRVRITLAVAGFSAVQLEVTLEDNQLNIAGKREGAEGERAYLHRGHRRARVRPLVHPRRRHGGGGGEPGARPAPHRSLPTRAREESEANPDPHCGLNQPRLRALV